MHTRSPIIVLDSGMGGLTVAAALQKTLPGEEILYFGDTAHFPYGSKSAASVTRFVIQIIGYLLRYEPKYAVIACNTATATALPAIRAAFPGLTISGVVEPGAKAAVMAGGAKPSPVIGVIATQATIQSGAYDRAILHRRHHARLLLQATPLLAPIIEDGRDGNDPLVRVALKQYLLPLLKHEMDVLVLGCTHYPILKEAIVRIVGPLVRVIDSAEQCAQDVALRLRSRALCRDNRGEGVLKTFVTDDPAGFASRASAFLRRPIEVPTWVSPEELCEQPAILPKRRAI